VIASVTWTNVSVAFSVPSAYSVADFNMQITLNYEHLFYVSKFHAAAVVMFPENITIVIVDCGRGDKIRSLAFRLINFPAVQKVSTKFYQSPHLYAE
jgi:hypothetical protein